MTWVAVAIGGSALIGGAASYMGGKSASKGNESAVNAEWAMFQQAREDYAPWRDAGKWSLEQLLGRPGSTTANPLGAKPDRADPKYWTIQSPQSTAVGDYAYTESPIFNEESYRDDLSKWTAAEQSVTTTPGTPGLLTAGPGEFKPTEDPGYKFGYQEFIEKPTLQLASATGKLRSSDMLKNLTKYASDYASTKYDSFLNRYYQRLNPLLSLAGMGQTAAGGSANTSMTAGSNIGQLALNQGNINSGTYAGYGGAAQQGIQNYMNYRILDKFTTGVK